MFTDKLLYQYDKYNYFSTSYKRFPGVVEQIYTNIDAQQDFRRNTPMKMSNYIFPLHVSYTIITTVFDYYL